MYHEDLAEDAEEDLAEDAEEEEKGEEALASAKVPPWRAKTKTPPPKHFKSAANGILAWRS